MLIATPETGKLRIYVYAKAQGERDIWVTETETETDQEEPNVGYNKGSINDIRKKNNKKNNKNKNNNTTRDSKSTSDEIEVDITSKPGTAMNQMYSEVNLELRIFASKM